MDGAVRGAAAELDQLQLYFAITVILAIAGWTGLARVVRGKLISLRNADYVTARVLSGVRIAKSSSAICCPVSPAT